MLSPVLACGNSRAAVTWRIARLRTGSPGCAVGVTGPGGLLTTVGDLLRWTAALESGELGGPGFVAEMHRQATLNNGRTIEYASGLFVTEHRGTPEVSHSGAPALLSGRETGRVTQMSTSSSRVWDLRFQRRR
jgi:hypothetical protein